MVLYEKQSDKVLSLADLSKEQCSTDSDYVSCEIDAVDSKNSLLRVLVVDLAEGQSRTYGCNASIVTSGGRFQVVSWSVVVHHRSEYDVYNHNISWNFGYSFVCLVALNVCRLHPDHHHPSTFPVSRIV